MATRTERIHYSGNGESLLFLSYLFIDITFHFSRSQYPYLNLEIKIERNLCQIVPPGLKFNRCQFHFILTQLEKTHISITLNPVPSSSKLKREDNCTILFAIIIISSTCSVHQQALRCVGLLDIAGISASVGNTYRATLCWPASCQQA